MRKNNRRTIVFIAVLLLLIIMFLTAYFIMNRYRNKTDKSSNAAINANSSVHEGFEAYYKEPDAANILLNEDNVEYINNQLLVTVDPDSVGYDTVEKIAEENDAEIVGYVSFSGDYQFELKSTKNEEELLTLAESIAEKEEIESCKLHYGYKTTAEFNDPWNNDAEWTSVPGGSNWWAEAVNADDVWDYYLENTNKFSQTKVGVYDSVFQTDHEDMKDVYDNVWYNPENFNEYYQDDSDDSINKTHGTHVAGLIAAKLNETGMAGVCQTCTIDSFSKYDSNFDGEFKIKYALALMLNNNDKVINISQGLVAGQIAQIKDSDIDEYIEDNSYSEDIKEGITSAGEFIDSYNTSLERFLSMAISNNYDFVICKSAGNNSGDEYIYDDSAEFNFRKVRQSEAGQGFVVKNADAEKDYFSGISSENIKSRIIVVGAAAQSQNEDRYYATEFTNVGGRVDVYAPGKDIYSTIPYNDYDSKSGTSMAAPIVSGIAANLWSADAELSGPQVKEIIVSSMKNNNLNYTMSDIFAAYESDENLAVCEVPIVDAYSALTQALKTKGEDPPEPKEVILTVEVKNKKKKKIDDALITIEADSEPLVFGETGTDGVYSTTVKIGKEYSILVTKEGYKDYEYTVTAEKNIEPVIIYLEEKKRTEKDLKSAVKKAADGNIGVWAYHDYDGDGNKEAFAIIVSKEDKAVIKQVYFVNYEAKATLVRDDFWGGNYQYNNSADNVVDDRRFFAVLTHAGGSGATAYIFGADGLSSFEPDVSGQYESFFTDENNKIYCVTSDYLINGGHFWYDHQMHFNNNSKQFTVDENEALKDAAYYAKLVKANESKWLRTLNDNPGGGNNSFFFADLDFDGTPEFIAGGCAFGAHGSIEYHVYKFENDKMVEMKMDTGNNLAFWQNGESYYNIPLYILRNNSTGNCEMIYSCLDGTATYSVRKLCKLSITGKTMTEEVLLRYYTYYEDGSENKEITNSSGEEISESEFIKIYDNYTNSSDYSIYKLVLYPISCSDYSDSVYGLYDDMSDSEKTYAIKSAYIGMMGSDNSGYKFDDYYKSSNYPLEEFVDSIR